MNRDITIAQAAAGGAAEIYGIESACFAADAFSQRRIAYLISAAKGMFWVARTGGRIAGYLSLLTGGRHGNGRIYSVAVHPEYRGAGIAGALIDEAVEYSRRKHLKAIFLEVRSDNRAAISLYEAKGFRKRSVKKGYYADGADADSMVLYLNSK